MCCSMTMPVEAGTPTASKDNPLLGVYISLDTRVMTELAIEMESAAGVIKKPNGGEHPEGLTLAHWTMHLLMHFLGCCNWVIAQQIQPYLGIADSVSYTTLF